MDASELIPTVQHIAETELSCSAHLMDHVMRVHNMCLHLSEDGEHLDIEVLRLAALLHDIAKVKEDQDNTGNTDHAMLGASMAEQILRKLQVPSDKIKKIIHCISTHRYRTDNQPKSIEAKILFDADKLDIIGAIGIARSFMLAGQFHQAVFATIDIETYIRDNLVGGTRRGRVKDVTKHTPNLELATKLRAIPDALYTPKAREIALERIAFMEQFFEKLERELLGHS